MKQFVEKYTYDIWNRREIDVIDKFFDTNAVIHSTLGDFRGPEDMKKIVNTWFIAFPDIKINIQFSIQDKDKIAVHWDAACTHQGIFKDIAPTGNQISYSGITVYRIPECKILEYWAYVDMEYIIHQLRKG